MKTRRDFLKSLMIGGVAALVPSAGFAKSVVNQRRKPNVVLIVCDDLNDYVAGMAGHPQASTPHIARLARSGVAFRGGFQTGLQQQSHMRTIAIQLPHRNLPTHFEKPVLGQVARESRVKEL